MQITEPARPILLPHGYSLNPHCLVLSRHRSMNPCSVPAWNNLHSCTKNLECVQLFMPMKQQVNLNSVYITIPVSHKKKHIASPLKSDQLTL
jgi:hypothetical protein